MWRLLAASLLASPLCALPALADTAPVYLVRDIDAAPSSLSVNAGGGAAVAGGSVFFEGHTVETGWELYRTDGTGEGTVLVKDIVPGPEHSLPNTFTSANGTVFFLVDDVIWKTDGTAAGTASLNVSPYQFNPNIDPMLVPMGGALFFSDFSSAAGAELWKTDGTVAGTVLVKDINPGTSSSEPMDAVEMNGSLFFSADGGNGRELWKSDGTAAGTVLVKDINPGAGGSGPHPLAAVNGILFFSAFDGVHGLELWKSDGTEAGTVLVKDLSPLAFNSTFVSGVAVDGRLVFTGSATPGGNGIWSSDGTDTGTGQLLATTLSAGPLVRGAGAAYARLDDGTHGYELWRSDGTVAGTALVKDILPGSGSGLTAIGIDLNGTLFFHADDGIHGSEMWRTDGTEAGTTLLKDIAPGSASSSNGLMVDLDGTLLFRGSNGVSSFWTSDGTPEGTLEMTGDPFAGTASSSPQRLTDVNGTLFFTAGSGTLGTELFKSDGSEAGTVLVKDIFPGTGQFGPNSSIPRNLHNLNGILVFTVDATHAPLGTNGLWRSDGTEAGTFRIGNGASGVVPGTSTVMNGQLFYAADELWKSDGTAAGTVLLKDIVPGSTRSSPQQLTDVNGTLFFRANNFSQSPQLWKSDGTTAGTVFVANLVVPIEDLTQQELTNVNGTLFFRQGSVLWKSDGTTAGTVMVKSFLGLTALTNLNGTLYFAGVTSLSPFDIGLWKSDGTPAGTVLVKPLGFPQLFPTPPQPPFANLGGTLYFAATGLGSGTGIELWKSDGTAEGTVLIEDAVPGSGSLSPAKIRVTGSRVLFEGNVPGHLQEPWTSDGTAAGTHPVAEIAPMGGSLPDEFVLQGTSVVFAAQNNAVGRELFAVPIAALSDGDQDGLEDADESALGTDPDDADSDDDGLTDGAEVLTHGTDPLDADTDGDGHSDGEEVLVLGSDPLDPDDPGPAPPEVPLAGPWGIAALVTLLLAFAVRRLRYVA